MPHALQSVVGWFTAAGAGTNVVTPSAGDSFSVPSFALTSKCYIENLWAGGATSDFVRVRSSRLHDANQGLRMRVPSGAFRSILPWGMGETVYPSDTPVVEIDATGAGSGGIVLHYGFDDLPGVAPRLSSWSDISPRVMHVSGVEVDVTSGAIGTYGASAAINSLFDNFEAGADYALLGYSMTVGCLAVGITGKDTGNLRIAVPGSADGVESTDYFITMSEATGRPYIPIIAANNKGSTIVQNVDTAAATASKVTLIMAQLA
jgi:hypothetical protein